MQRFFRKAQRWQSLATCSPVSLRFWLRTVLVVAVVWFWLGRIPSMLGSRSRRAASPGTWPTVFVIGVPKAATTSLSNVLFETQWFCRPRTEDGSNKVSDTVLLRPPGAVHPQQPRSRQDSSRAARGAGGALAEPQGGVRAWRALVPAALWARPQVRRDPGRCSPEPQRPGTLRASRPTRAAQDARFRPRGAIPQRPRARAPRNDTWTRLPRTSTRRARRRGSMPRSRAP